VDGEEADEPGPQFLAPGNDFFHDFSDTDSSVSVSNSMYRSMTPSPAESPTCGVRQNDASDRDATSMTDSDDARVQISASITDEGEGVNTSCRIVDFCDDIWCPPPPEDESDDLESRIFGLDEDDDGIFSGSSCFSANRISGADGVSAGAHKEFFLNELLKHFRALVAQLLKGEGISLDSGNDSKIWLEIVSSLAWEAGNYVKPDTKKGGSMDPGDYVKIKCVASGNPSDRYVLARVSSYS
jgi:1-phosphatidylinositol-3-phosphate 5-kinase